jgi:hypothetical protein
MENFPVFLRIVITHMLNIEPARLYMQAKSPVKVKPESRILAADMASAILKSIRWIASMTGMFANPGLIPGTAKNAGRRLSTYPIINMTAVSIPASAKRYVPFFFMVPPF